VSTDLDLFAQAARLQGLPAEPQPDAAPEPVDVEQTPSERIAAVSARLDAIRAEAKALAAEVRAASYGYKLTTNDRSRVLYHLDHAAEHGAVYSVWVAIKILRGEA
jgi:hypothetical protein